jgi:ribonuclease HII
MSNDKISHNKIDNIYTKKLNKTDGQTRCLKVKNDTLFRTEGVASIISKYTRDSHMYKGASVTNH